MILIRGRRRVLRATFFFCFHSLAGFLLLAFIFAGSIPRNEDPEINDVL